METSLQEQLSLALEDFDTKRSKSVKLKNELKTTKEFVATLKEKLAIA